MSNMQIFIRMLGSSDEEIESIVDEMEEKDAKQMLKVLMKEIKKMK